MPGCGFDYILSPVWSYRRAVNAGIRALPQEVPTGGNVVADGVGARKKEETPVRG